MEALITNFFNLEIMAQAWPILLRGLGMTLFLCAMVIPIGLVGGLLVALLSLHRNRALRWPVIVLVDVFRALPPLVLLIFIAAGLPFAGFDPGPFGSVALAFFLNTSAYFGEILRAGIQSVPKGQMEAARSTGLSAFEAMVFVVLPQAIRNVLPDLLSNVLEVAKLTSIASVVALQELLYAADMARSITYNASPIVMAAGLYLLFLWPLVRLLSLSERRLARGR